MACRLVNSIPGMHVAAPNSTFYLFPDVTEAMQRVGTGTLGDFAEQALHNTGVSFCTRRHFGRPQPGRGPPVHPARLLGHRAPPTSVTASAGCSTGSSRREARVVVTGTDPARSLSTRCAASTRCPRGTAAEPMSPVGAAAPGGGCRRHRHPAHRADRRRAARRSRRRSCRSWPTSPSATTTSTCRVPRARRGRHQHAGCAHRSHRRHRDGPDPDGDAPLWRGRTAHPPAALAVGDVLPARHGASRQDAGPASSSLPGATSHRPSTGSCSRSAQGSTGGRAPGWRCP